MTTPTISRLLERYRASGVGAEDQPLAQRVAIRKVAALKRLVDDHDLRRAGSVLRREIAASDQRRTYCLEIARTDYVIVERHSLAGLRLIALYGGSSREQVIAQRAKLRETRRLDSGQSHYSLSQLLVEELPARLVITAEARMDRHYERPCGIEAGVNRLKSLEATRAKTRADQHEE